MAIHKCAEIHLRRPYQTRYIFACWCLTTRDHLAFISIQIGHKDFTVLVKVYAKWMDDERPHAIIFIWNNLLRGR